MEKIFSTCVGRCLHAGSRIARGASEGQPGALPVMPMTTGSLPAATESLEPSEVRVRYFAPTIPEALNTVRRQRRWPRPAVVENLAARDRTGGPLSVVESFVSASFKFLHDFLLDAGHRKQAGTSEPTTARGVETSRGKTCPTHVARTCTRNSGWKIRLPLRQRRIHSVPETSNKHSFADAKPMSQLGRNRKISVLD